ncbi:MAG: formyltransferase family protein [Gordonia sp. (in: high G+C Gram-positive bacteria)]
MIFIGRGALLTRAVRSALTGGHLVDLVCVPGGDVVPFEALLPFEALGVRAIVSDDVNADAETLRAACTDGIGWSINNPAILRSPLLDSGIAFYNIHNGPLPAYRGIPEVAVMHAILNGESSYAATLHRVDAGIDTGDVVDVEEFPIGSDDGFAQVMMAGLRACHTLFERNFGALVAGSADPTPAARTASARVTMGEIRPGYYGRLERAALAEFAEHPRFGRATSFGVFAPHFPELAVR